jgi:ATP-dependent helicase HrpA
LPSQVAIRDREVDIDYDVEERDGKRVGVARLRLPEKIARTLTELEVPQLDRPVRFVVLRGQRGAVRADNLEDLQERLAQPYSPDEVEEAPGDDAMLPNAEREVRRIAGEFRRHRRGGRKGERGSGAPRGRSDLRKRRRRR